MIIQETDYLAHYGVKGMRWGVRKEYEPKGRKKASSTPVISEKKQLTSEEKKARNKAIAKKVAIGAAVVGATLAVVGGVYIYKKSHREHWAPPDLNSQRLINEDALSDKVLSFSKGSKFQRISSKSFEDLRSVGRTYVSYLKKDNRIYKETFPKLFSSSGKSTFTLELTSKRPIRVASDKAMVDAYKKLYNVTQVREGSFNYLMNRLENYGDSEVESYFKIIREMGFDGIVDKNDQGWSKSPLILINPGELLDITKAKKLGVIERVINTLLL